MRAVQVSEKHNRGSRATAQANRVRGRRILVVEDESAISRLLREVLRDCGFEVVVATNGKEGLDFLKTHWIDGIILDLEMPIMDGSTMLDELRWHGDQTPVIVMSGGADSGTLRNMLKEGAQGFFVKPFTHEILRAQCLRYFASEKKFFSPDSARALKGQPASLQMDVA